MNEWLFKFGLNMSMLKEIISYKYLFVGNVDVTHDINLSWLVLMGIYTMNWDKINAVHDNNIVSVKTIDIILILYLNQMYWYYKLNSSLSRERLLIYNWNYLVRCDPVEDYRSLSNPHPVDKECIFMFPSMLVPYMVHHCSQWS